MSDDGTPTLEVGFDINPGASLSTIQTLDDLIGKAEADAVRSFQKMEQAAQSLNLGSAALGMKAFGTEVASAAAEVNKIEKAGEALSRQLDRQISTFGMTTTEIRAMRVETRAAASEAAGLTEQADRLRAQHQTLVDLEKQVADAAILEAAAIRDAAIAFQQFEQAARAGMAAMNEAELREATQAYQMFEARVRAGAAALREEEAALERINYRDAAIAHQQFEDRVRAGTAAMRDEEQAAIKDAEAAARFHDMLDPTAAAQRNLNDAIVQARRVMTDAGFSAEEMAIVEKKLADQAAASSGRLKEHASILGLNSMQMTIGVGAAHRFIDSIMAGASPMRAFAQQGGDVIGVLQTDDGGIAGGLAKVRGLINPVTISFAALTAVVIGGVAAWLSYSNAMEKLTALAQGSGRMIGATGDQLEAIAEAGAHAGNISVSAARDIETAYVQTGKIGQTVLTGLIGFTKDFGAATQQNATEASKVLATAFADPAKGADELTTKYGILDAKTLDYIHTLVSQGRETEAQQVLLKGLETAFDHAADHANVLARAWTAIKTEAADAWTWMGKAIDRALGGGTISDQIASLQKSRAAQLDISGGYADVSGLDKQIADLQKQLAAQKAKDSTARAQSDAVAGMNLVGNYNGDNQKEQLQRDLTAVNKLLIDNGKAAGLSADQLAKAREAQDAYTHALDTFRSPAEKQNQIDALAAQIAAARDPKIKAALETQKRRVELSGQVITSAQAEADAHSKGAAALATASKAGENHAATLAREAAAQEAQIRNLDSLAAAYGVSGGAALIAEAREKAESKAVKERGDVEAAVSREIRLLIAQRLVDLAKSIAGLRDQADAQEKVNAMVEAGLVPATKAAQLVQDQITDLPTLNAIQAAQISGETAKVAELTKALDDQRAARDRVRAATATAQVDLSLAAGKDQIAYLQEETRLIGANDAARVHALATLKATQEANKMIVQGVNPAKAAEYVKQQVAIADQTEAVTESQRHYNEALNYTAELMAAIDETARLTGQSMADAFGKAGQAAGDALSAVTGYYSKQSSLDAAHNAAIKKAGTDQAAIDQANALYARQSTDARMQGLIGLTSAAKNMFDQNSKGYKVMEGAEKALTIVQLARTAVDVAGGAARMFSTLGPFAFPAVAAMLGVMAALGFGSGGAGISQADYTKGNDGTGTVLGDATAKSDSISKSIDLLKNVDDATLSVNRDMLTSLRAIQNSIAGVSSLIVQGGDINANSSVTQGFSSSAAGTAVSAILDPLGTIFKGIPVLGSIASFISSLFGTKTTVVGSGIYGGAQSIGDILSGGFDAQSYSDIEKKKKFLGITTGTSYSTVYGSDVDASITNQFALILKGFDDAIVAAAGPLGKSTDQISSTLSNFVFTLGKIDLQGLTGDEIEQKLEAVFGAAGDAMAQAAIPGLEKFEQVGEGYLETLVRVASTVEQVDATFQKLGKTTTSLGVDIDMTIAGMFDSVSDFTSAASTYFNDFYSSAEKSASETAQLTKAFDSLGLTLPDSLQAYRQLVDAQDLTTAAGQQMYVTLLQLAPAFSDLIGTMQDSATVAAVAKERQDLQGQIWDLLGDTADIRAAQLATLDPSNRALQEQIYAITDAQAAAKAADDLRQAWQSVGDTIMEEVNRIRGLTDTAGGGSSFATLLGQFNAATAAARAGDQDAAKNLPTLSQNLLTAAAASATSRQELDRVQAQTAASLEQTYATITALTGSTSTTDTDTTSLLSSIASSSATTASANDNIVSAIEALQAEVAGMRGDNNSGNAAIAAPLNSIDKTLDNVTAASGGNKVSVA